MCFRNLKLNPVYFSDEHNILEDFYIPCLKETKNYKRISGFFSSNALAVAAVGYGEFAKRGGKMQLIMNVHMTSDDASVIKEYISSKEKTVIEDIENITEELKKNHIRMLGYLLKKGNLEIKISCDPTGKGIEHQKVGILEDFDGHTIAFYGSDNETKHGWLYHNESFHISRNWEPSEINHLIPELSRFDSFWENQGKKFRVYDVSAAFKNELIKSAPNEEEFEKLDKESTERLLEEYRKQYQLKKMSARKEIELTPIQVEAVNSWFKKGCAGIVVMATGTGKTYVGCSCIKKLLEKEKKLGVLIITPQNTIAKQWIQDSLPEFSLSGSELYGTSKKRIGELVNAILDIKNGYENYFVIGTTYATFSKEKFVSALLHCNFPILIIADEVHSVGTELRDQGLKDNYQYRLGLSATPRRTDPEGTEIIYDYFYKGKYDEKKGDTYVFDIKSAMKTINPITKKTYLTPYSYYPQTCDLTVKEYEEYKQYSKEISKAYAIARQTKDYKFYNHLCIKRKNILKNARNKIDICGKILEKLEQNNRVDHCLFFLDSEKQIDQLRRILDNKFPHRMYKIFTSKELSNLEERVAVLHDFEVGHFQILLSIGCFDEGIDVPSTRIAVLVASSTNPREFVQRRGRVLRQSFATGKIKAEIYDILVFPPKAGPDESAVIDSEIKRFEIFLDDCDNKLEAFNNVKDRY